MFARALLAFLAMPAVVAIALPLWLSHRDAGPAAPRLPGLALAAAGLLGLLWCIRDFYVIGKGTLAPWAPPRRLVVVGLYRFTRNPMYVSVLTLVAGIGISRDSTTTLGYALVLAVAFHLRVVLNEEGFLARSFPADWTAYRREVPRWLPRLRPWRGPDPTPGA